MQKRLVDDRNEIGDHPKWPVWKTAKMRFTYRARGAIGKEEKTKKRLHQVIWGDKVV